MARPDALLKLHQRLIAQRDDLRQKLSLPAVTMAGGAGGDAADLAASDVERELESQLVSLESRELVRIHKAIDAIKNGTYGQCERCGERIPVARLQALPHTSCCVECQRRVENRHGKDGDDVDWTSAWEFSSRDNDSELTMRDLRLDVE